MLLEQPLLGWKLLVQWPFGVLFCGMCVLVYELCRGVVRTNVIISWKDEFRGNRRSYCGYMAEDPGSI